MARTLCWLVALLPKRMIDAGLEPVVWQAIEWVCLAFVPVFPLGTRIVASSRDDSPNGDDYGRSIPIAMDSLVIIS